MTIINKEWYEKLENLRVGKNTYSFTFDEMEKFKRYIHKNIDNKTLLMKRLGIFYPTIINLLTEAELDTSIIETIGLENFESEDILYSALQILLDEEKKTKFYGDSEVTEELNYLSIEEKEIIIEKFWDCGDEYIT